MMKMELYLFTGTINRNPNKIEFFSGIMQKTEIKKTKEAVQLRVTKTREWGY